MRALLFFPLSRPPLCSRSALAPRSSRPTPALSLYSMLRSLLGPSPSPRRPLSPSLLISLRGVLAGRESSRHRSPVLLDTYCGWLVSYRRVSKRSACDVSNRLRASFSQCSIIPDPAFLVGFALTDGRASRILPLNCAGLALKLSWRMDGILERVRAQSGASQFADFELSSYRAQAVSEFRNKQSPVTVRWHHCVNPVDRAPPSRKETIRVCQDSRNDRSVDLAQSKATVAFLQVATMPAYRVLCQDLAAYLVACQTRGCLALGCEDPSRPFSTTVFLVRDVVPYSTYSKWLCFEDDKGSARIDHVEEKL